MNERQNEIFDIVSKKPTVTVKELSKILVVSQVTIRKDLSLLENQGLLRRTHGGAMQIASNSIEKRIHYRYDEKLKIVKEAVKLIEDGENVLIEAGSTNAILAKELANKKGIHVITNSLYIAQMFTDNKNVKISILGGDIQQESQTIVGPLAKLCLSRIAVNKAFIGMDGFSEKLGFTCGDFLRAEVGKEMCYRAEKVIVLAESSKFDNVGFTSIVELSKVSLVITDKQINKEKLRILEENNIKVTVAN